MTGHQSFSILQIVKTSAKLTSTMQVLKVVGTLKVDAQHTSYVFKAVRRGDPPPPYRLGDA